jgi:hypothetical protein
MSYQGPRTSASVVVDSGFDGVMAGVSGTLDTPVAADRRSDSVPYPEGPKSPVPSGRAGLCHRTLRQATDRNGNRDLQTDRVDNCRKGRFDSHSKLDVSRIRLLPLFLGDLPFSWRVSRNQNSRECCTGCASVDHVIVQFCRCMQEE